MNIKPLHDRVVIKRMEEEKVSAGGIVIPDGSLLTDSTGQVIYQTVGATTTDGPPNTAPISIISVTKGAQANQPVGARLTFSAPVPGVDPDVTLVSPLRRGQDRETEVQLRVDEAVSYGQVVTLMGAAQKAGLSRIGFVAQPASR